MMFERSLPALHLLLAASCGFLIGGIITAWSMSGSAPITFVDDEVADVAVVRIDGIRNGGLEGVAEGDVRVVAGSSVVPLNSSGAFRIHDVSLLTNQISIDVPQGMHFVASRRGKKYYSVDSADGQRIVPENRVYFPDEASAQKAGFVR